MKLKYKHHFYKDEGSYEIEIPDDTVFIYVDGDVGDCLYDGYNHYLGATKSDFSIDNYGVTTYDQFPGLTFIVFNNVIFESEIPIISSKEFYERFDIGNYYIFKSTKEEYKPILDGSKLKDFETIPSKPISIGKILSIESPYRVKTFTIFIDSIFGGNLFSINCEGFVELETLTDDFHLNVKIKKNCEQEFINYINKVLSLVNYKVVSDQPSD